MNPTPRTDDFASVMRGLGIGYYQALAFARQLESELILITTPQPIETAPRDGTPIIGLCRHDADLYINDEGDQLTTYRAHCEGLVHVEDGIHVLVWGGEYQEGDWESGYTTVPAWWFLNDGHFETPANPTHWLPLSPKLVELAK